LFDLAVEALVRGLNPKELNESARTSYREGARAKQLPPDTEDWLDLLAIEDSETQVSIVSDVINPENNKPRLLRADQLSPEEQEHWLKGFFIWFIRSGRGFGKSWTGSNWINEGAEQATGEYMAIMGRDAHDVRAFCIEGDSGVLRTARRDFYPKYEPSKRLITWPNGVKAQVFYAEEPNTIRGPNNFRAWADEPASYQDAHLGLNPETGEDTAMSNLLMTLRKGDPQLCITGTPKPVKLIKDLLKEVGTIIIEGGTRENKANVSDKWLRKMDSQYGGTRLGRQELDGEVLDDNPGALWRREWIERDRVSVCPILERIVVGIDPQAVKTDPKAIGKAVTSGVGKTGIIAAGRWFNPGDQRYHFYVLEDKTGNYSPKEWATVAKNMFDFWLADRVVAERNNGGDMVESNIHTVDENLPVTVVWASRGKHIRAEPNSALSEQGRIHHVGPGRNFVDLEDQCCEWEPGMESPNNLDAFVWAITELMDAGTTDDDTDAHTDFWNRDDDFEQDLARSLGLED
jgi:phage terminase large subunit-like protein